MQRDFGHTDQHVYRTGAVQSERVRAMFQQRHEEPIPSEFAAHAASEFTDDEPAPVPRMTTTDVVLMLLLWSASLVIVIGLGAAVAPVVANFILWVRT